MTPVLVAFNLLLVAAGMLFLYGGGGGLVRGASGIALHLNISPVVIGLTVVAFGTSAPELFVSVLSAVQGKMGVSLGNVLGSNVINIALILGIAAVARPVEVHRTVIRFDGPFMLVTYALVALGMVNFRGDSLWLGGTILRWEGLVLVTVLVVYVIRLHRRSGRAGTEEPSIITELPDDEDAIRPLWLDGTFVVVGVALLAVGAEIMVRGASALATDLFGASERFVGIAIVAFGTSLPELFTTIAGISRKEMDISVGNIVGSNIFNSLMVLGSTALIRPVHVGQTDYRGDFAFMVGITALLLLFLFMRKKVPRWGGVLFLGIYGVYFVFLMATRAM